jgi:sugar lactone lactonase YvrE
MRNRENILAFIFCLLAGPVMAGALVAIDSDAHYPEGPLWREGALFYVEYAAGNIRRWDGQHASVWWHQDGCGASGLAEWNGHLLVACYDDNSVVELDAIGKVIRVIRQDSRGKAFAGPNDFAADGHGGIYFSASGAYEASAPISGTIVHISADGKTISEVANLIHYSNGLTVAKDGKHLLVAEMLAGRVLSFAIGERGALGARMVWARLRDLAPAKGIEDVYNGPDGLKLGPDDNYYIAQNGSGRVLVVGADKKLVRSIDVPTPYVTNIAFGPAGSGTVFIVGLFDEFNAPFPGAVYRWSP